MITKEKVEQLLKEYNASDLDELIDIVPDLVLDLEDEDEDELPQQEGVDQAEYFLTYKESDVPIDASCPFSFVPYPFNN